MARWMVVFTTVPPEEMNTKEVISLYRIRWQVELSIKRCKSQLNLSKQRCQKDSKLGELWILGKLLYAACVEKKISQVRGDHWHNLQEERVETPWGSYEMIHTLLVGKIIGSDYWDMERFEEAMEVRRERSRRRKLATLPTFSFGKFHTEAMAA